MICLDVSVVSWWEFIVDYCFRLKLCICLVLRVCSVEVLSVVMWLVENWF